MDQRYLGLGRREVARRDVRLQLHRPQHGVRRPDALRRDGAGRVEHERDHAQGAGRRRRSRCRRARATTRSTPTCCRRRSRRPTTWTSRASASAGTSTSTSARTCRSTCSSRTCARSRPAPAATSNGDVFGVVSPVDVARDDGRGHAGHRRSAGPGTSRPATCTRAFNRNMYNERLNALVGRQPVPGDRPRLHVDERPGRTGAGPVQHVAGQRGHARRVRLPLQDEAADAVLGRPGVQHLDAERSVPAVHDQLGDLDADGRAGQRASRRCSSSRSTARSTPRCTTSRSRRSRRRVRDPDALPRLRPHEQDEPLRHHGRRVGFAGPHLSAPRRRPPTNRTATRRRTCTTARRSGSTSRPTTTSRPSRSRATTATGSSSAPAARPSRDARTPTASRRCTTPATSSTSRRCSTRTSGRPTAKRSTGSRKTRPRRPSSGRASRSSYSPIDKVGLGFTYYRNDREYPNRPNRVAVSGAPVPGVQHPGHAERPHRRQATTPTRWTSSTRRTSAPNSARWYTYEKNTATNRWHTTTPASP